MTNVVCGIKHPQEVCKSNEAKTLRKDSLLPTLSSPPLFTIQESNLTASKAQQSVKNFNFDHDSFKVKESHSSCLAPLGENKSSSDT